MSTGAKDTIRVVVDPERCVGIGQCEMLEPEVFEVDDEGTATVIGSGMLPADRADVVVSRCPSGAISTVAVPPAPGEAPAASRPDDSGQSRQ